MSEPTAPAAPQVESDEALFDIVVQLASGSSLENVKDKALNDLGMEPLKVEALIRALQSGPTARIGSSVPKTRAEKARDDFTKAGLKVTLSTVLSISKMTAAESDGKTQCPACEVRVVLPENRQCPNCNVFVDKVDEQFLLRKKLTEQERRRAEMALDREKKISAKASKEAMEREMREQVRKEVEAEMGISDGKGGMAMGSKIKLGVAALGLAGAAFFGGKFAAGGGGGETSAGKADDKSGSIAATSAAVAAKPADLDQIMQNLPSAGTLDPASAELLDDAAQEEALMKSARNGGPNAKGISMDQALAASMQLASAVGNTTAQRALNGASGPSGGASAAAGPAFVPAQLPADFKPLLSLEFADQLAQMGQSSRARGVLREIQTLPNPTPALSTAAQVSDIVISAWGVSSATAEKSRKLLDNVKSGVAALREPAAKAKAASAAASALALQSRSPEQIAQAFLSQAAEAAGQVGDAAQRQIAADELLISTGQVLLAGVNSASKTGNWERATELSNRLQTATKQSRTPAATAKLLAMLSQAKSVTTADASASQSLDSAIGEALKAASVAEKAMALHAVADITGSSGAASVMKALQSVEPAAAQATGIPKVQAMGAMSAAYASVGDEAKAEEMRRQIAAATGIAPVEHQMEMAKALLRSDTSLARFQQRTGAYAQAESTIQRAASYLFKAN
jgi:hypothetical protein